MDGQTLHSNSNGSIPAHLPPRQGKRNVLHIQGLLSSFVVYRCLMLFALGWLFYLPLWVEDIDVMVFLATVMWLVDWFPTEPYLDLQVTFLEKLVERLKQENGAQELIS